MVDKDTLVKLDHTLSLKNLELIETCIIHEIRVIEKKIINLQNELEEHKKVQTRVFNKCKETYDILKEKEEKS